jgi:hypothetical protein
MQAGCQGPGQPGGMPGGAAARPLWRSSGCKTSVPVTSLQQVTDSCPVARRPPARMQQPRVDIMSRGPVEDSAQLAVVGGVRLSPLMSGCDVRHSGLDYCHVGCCIVQRALRVSATDTVLCRLAGISAGAPPTMSEVPATDTTSRCHTLGASTPKRSGQGHMRNYQS